MIDEARKRIYYDFTTRSMFQECKEKANLATVQGWKAKSKLHPSLIAMDFGHAFHAAVAAYYDALAGGWWSGGNGKRIWVRFDSEIWEKPAPHGTDPTAIAKTAFIEDLRKHNAALPIQLEGDEKRSVERGLALVEAYIERWANEPYENIIRPDGSPMTEISFEIFLAHYNGYDIYYVGTIDRFMRNIITKRPTIFELKTTGESIDVYIQRCNPNHQPTGYFKIAWENYLPDVRECVWDVVFISKRQSNIAKSLTDRFWLYGVDIENDFRRQITTRSQTDVTDFMIDLEADALDYAKWLLSGLQRWPRSAPTACHMYAKKDGTGGCQFKEVCKHAGNRALLESAFEVKPWNPAARLMEDVSER